VDLLVEPRHADDEGGLHLLEVLEDLGEVLGKDHLLPGVQGGVVTHRPLEGMGQGQEGQEGVLLLEELRVHGIELVYVGDQVKMREHHALGVSGGPRGIYNGGEVLGIYGPDPLVHLGLVPVPAALLHGGLEVYDPFHRRSKAVE
jgi:hypothetical protein